ATSLVWHELALTGGTAHDFEGQIAELQPFLAEHWRVREGRTGNLVHEKPIVLVIYREDHKFLLDQVRPRRGFTQAGYDLVIASQPYRARAPVEFKARRIVAPLAKSLAPGGRLIAIHSHGHDPGLEIIQRVWPGEDPFTTHRHARLPAPKAELGSAALVAARSIGISPRDPLAGDALRDLFAPETTIFVAHPPSASCDDVVAACVRLHRAGFNPIPHVAARRLASLIAASDFLERAAG